MSIKKNNQLTSIDDDELVDIAHQVVSDLNDMQIRPTPICFEGWFHFKTKFDNKFSAAVENLIRDKKELCEEDFQSIREEIENKKYSIDQFNFAIEDLFSHVTGLEECRSVLSGSTKFLNREMASTRAKLADPIITIAKVRKIIEQFSTTLEETEQKNMDLERQLSDSIQQIETLKESVHKIKDQANTDALTGVWNRRYFNQCLEEEVDMVKKNGNSVALLVLDIDFFKSFNDKYGHETGDQVIKYTAQTLKQNSRTDDIVSRYGGDEFVIMLRDTEIAGGKAFADEFCKKISEKRLKSRTSKTDLGRLTVTIGGTVIARGDTPKSAFTRADNALLEAKRAGRNRALMVAATSQAA